MIPFAGVVIGRDGTIHLSGHADGSVLAIGREASR